MDCELLSWCRVIIWLTIRETEVSLRRAHTHTHTHSSTKLLNTLQAVLADAAFQNANYSPCLYLFILYKNLHLQCFQQKASKISLLLNQAHNGTSIVKRLNHWVLNKVFVLQQSTGSKSQITKFQNCQSLIQWLYSENYSTMLLSLLL